MAGVKTLSIDATNCKQKKKEKKKMNCLLPVWLFPRHLIVRFKLNLVKHQIILKIGKKSFTQHFKQNRTPSVQNYLFSYTYRPLTDTYNANYYVFTSHCIYQVSFSNSVCHLKNDAMETGIETLCETFFALIFVL